MIGLLINPDDGSDTVRLGDRIVPRQLTVDIRDVPRTPLVRLKLAVIGDRPQCREIHIVSAEGAPEIRQSDLNAVRLAGLIEHAYALAATAYAEGDPLGRLTELPQAVKTVRQARKGRPARKLTREFLAEVAAVYRRNAGDRPTQTVAEAFGIAHSTAAEYVRRTRAEGLLPKTTPGKKTV